MWDGRETWLEDCVRIEGEDNVGEDGASGSEVEVACSFAKIISTSLGRCENSSC